MIDALIFDIETAMLPVEQLEAFIPEFTAPSNYKDQAKIDEAIAKKMADWYSKAALDPVTGRVLCIGVKQYTSEGPTFTILEGDEREVIEQFWSLIDSMGMLNQCIGFNSHAFDVPFLVRRSWALKLSIPDDVMDGRYFSKRFIDLMDVWRLGNRQDSISLDTLSRYLGHGSKKGEGKDFAGLYLSDPEKAREYLRHDVELTALCADSLGVRDV